MRFYTLDQARAWRSSVNDPGTICAIKITGKILVADAALLLGESEALSATRDRARRYWRGERSPKPNIEVLVVGEVEVTAVSL